MIVLGHITISTRCHAELDLDQSLRTFVSHHVTLYVLCINEGQINENKSVIIQQKNVYKLFHPYQVII